MTIDEMQVAKIREAGFVGYDRSLHSKCKNPSVYGIQRTPRAERVLRTPREPNIYKCTVRVPKILIGDTDTLKEVCRVCGYESVTGWIKVCIRDLYAEYKKRTSKSAHSDVPKYSEDGIPRS